MTEAVPVPGPKTVGETVIEESQEELHHHALEEGLKEIVRLADGVVATKLAAPDAAITGLSSAAPAVEAQAELAEFETIQGLAGLQRQLQGDMQAMQAQLRADAQALLARQSGLSGVAQASEAAVQGSLDGSAQLAGSDELATNLNMMQGYLQGTLEATKTGALARIESAGSAQGMVAGEAGAGTRAVIPAIEPLEGAGTGMIPAVDPAAGAMIAESGGAAMEGTELSTLAEGLSTAVEAGGEVGLVYAAVQIGDSILVAMHGDVDPQAATLQAGTVWNPADPMAGSGGALAGGAVHTIQVANEGALVAAIHAVNAAAGNYAISMTGDITLSADLPEIGGTAGQVTLQGNGFTLEAAGHRGLVADGATLAVSDLTIQDAAATGGSGGSGFGGGGGGAGLGGGVLAVNHAQVGLSNVTFVDDSATGGAGGGAAETEGFCGHGYGGGGGMGGQGADGTSWQGSVGGVIGTIAHYIPDALVGSDTTTDYGNHLGASGGGGGFGTGTDGSNSGPGGQGLIRSDVGGGAGDGNNDDAAGGGGRGASGIEGGWGGGGGGGNDETDGGYGGFGAGGGGGNDGGNGGFGGGGGGSLTGEAGQGGFGAGAGSPGSSDGTAAGGGGGFGAGGDIFSDATSQIAILGGSVAGGNVSGGAGGDPSAGAGAADGGAIFLAGNQSLDVLAAAGQTTTISGQIADQSGSAVGGQEGYGTLVAMGSGVVALTNGSNSFAGGTAITQGATLEVTAEGAAGSGAVMFADGSTGQLQVKAEALNNAGVFTNDLKGLAIGDTVDLAGFSASGASVAVSGTATAADGSIASLVTVTNATGCESVMVEGLDAPGFVLSDDGKGGTVLGVEQTTTAPTDVVMTTASGSSPIFTGQASAGDTVTLYQLQICGPGAGTRLQLGATTAGADGTFTLSNGTAPDAGAGAIVAVATSADGDWSGFSAPVAEPTEGGSPPSSTDVPTLAPGTVVIRVGTEGQLAAAIQQANAGGTPGPLAIVFTQDITLSSDLPALDASSVQVLGTDHVLDGGGHARGLLVFGGQAEVADLTIRDAVAQGGSGGTGDGGGGGGAGLGGGLFVAGGASVVADNVTFAGNQAVGGVGGVSNDQSFAYGGGGGMGGAGGDGAANGYGGDPMQAAMLGQSPLGNSGGGGGLGAGTTGGNAGASGVAGQLTGAPADTTGGDANGGTAGGGGDGGNADGNDDTGYAGGGGGVFGLSGDDTREGGEGSTGGWGGGGGGNFGFGGDGGFGGGGGGGQTQGGHGGFGGGGGGGAPLLNDGAGATGGFGGGEGGQGTVDADAKGGGGGLGAGGNVYVEQGGKLILEGSTSGGMAAGGQGQNGGTDGQAYGAGIFIQGNDTMTLAAAAGHTTMIGDAIADEAGSHDASGASGAGALVVEGPGTVVLAGAASTYTGGTWLTGGTLELATQHAAGTGAISFDPAAGATLRVDSASLESNGTLGNTISGFEAGDHIDLTSLAYTDGATSVHEAAADASGHIAVAVVNGTSNVGLTLSGLGEATPLSVSEDGHGGTLLSLVSPADASGGAMSALSASVGHASTLTDAPDAFAVQAAAASVSSAFAPTAASGSPALAVSAFAMDPHPGLAPLAEAADAHVLFDIAHAGSAVVHDANA